MTYETGSIRQIHQRLRAEGINVSENTLRVWVRQKVLPAAFCGKKAYIYYPNVIALLQNGCQQVEVPREEHGGIRRLS